MSFTFSADAQISFTNVGNEISFCPVSVGGAGLPSSIQSGLSFEISEPSFEDSNETISLTVSMLFEGKHNQSTQSKSRLPSLGN